MHARSAHKEGRKRLTHAEVESQEREGEILQVQRKEEEGFFLFFLALCTICLSHVLTKRMTALSTHNDTWKTPAKKKSSSSITNLWIALNWPPSNIGRRNDDTCEMSPRPIIPHTHVTHPEMQPEKQLLMLNRV